MTWVVEERRRRVQRRAPWRASTCLRAWSPISGAVEPEMYMEHALNIELGAAAVGAALMLAVAAVVVVALVVGEEGEEEDEGAGEDESEEGGGGRRSDESLN